MNCIQKLGPGPCWGAYSTPRPPSWFKGDLLLRGRDGKGEEMWKEGKERREREGKGVVTCEVLLAPCWPFSDIIDLNNDLRSFIF